MPLTECAVHGESACVELCEHLVCQLDAGVYEAFHTLPIFGLRLCAGCFEAFDLPAWRDAALPDAEVVAALRADATGVRRIGPDHLFEAAALERDRPELYARLSHIYDVLNERSGLRCVGCIDRIQVDHARRTGQALGVPVFEHTIVNGEDPRIQQLARLLRERMHPRGNHGNQFFGCRVVAGTVLRPLTVRIYGAGDDDAQQATLDVIDRFFAGQADYQRRVELYAPMSWRVVEHEGGVQRTRRADQLLRAVLVDRR